VAPRARDMVLRDLRARRGFLDTFWFAWVAFHPDTRIVN
jgi:hypothetical protein